MFDSLAELIDAPEPVLAPLALDPLMARLAERAGFKAVYLGGGGLGYSKTFLEANLDLTQLAQAGVDIGAATSLPVILDGACGWGDAMHLRRTVSLAESAGFAAIEIEDQVYPKRAGHHVGDDLTIPAAAMAAKVRAAVEARRDERFLVIARTDVAKADPEEAISRSLAYREAGADVLAPVVGNIGDPAKIVAIGERLGPPLLFLCPPGGLAHVGLSAAEMHAAGFRILVDAMSLHIRVYESLVAGYAQLADGFTIDPERPNEEWWGELADLHATIDLEALLEIERREAGDD